MSARSVRPLLAASETPPYSWRGIPSGGVAPRSNSDNATVSLVPLRDPRRASTHLSSGLGRCGDWRQLAATVRGRPAGRPPLRRHRNVTRAAEQPIVLEPALAAAIRDGDDVIGFPTRFRRSPQAPRCAVGGWRFRARPFAVSLRHVEATELARAAIPFLDLFANVPRAAADLPLVHARLAAEGPPRPAYRRAAPPADRLSVRTANRLAPFLR